MGFIKKEIFIGLLVGLIAWSFGFYLYVEFSTEYSFGATLELMREGDLIGKVGQKKGGPTDVAIVIDQVAP